MHFMVILSVIFLDRLGELVVGQRLNGGTEAKRTHYSMKVLSQAGSVL